MSDIRKIFSKTSNTSNTSNKFDINNQSYYGKYGIDFIIACISILAFIGAILYFSALNYIPTIRANWAYNKCNPKYMNYVSYINPDKNKTPLAQSSENFNACVKNALRPVASASFKPVYYSLDVLTKSYDELADSMTDTKGEFSKMRTNMSDITKNINGKTVDAATSQVQQILTIKDIIEKMQAEIVGLVYSQKAILQSFLDIFN